MPETQVETEETVIRRTPEELALLFHALEQRLVDADGEFTPDIENLIATMDLSVSDLADRYGNFIRHLKARSKGLKAHAKEYSESLTRKAESSEHLAKRLERRLFDYLKATKQDRIKGDLRTIRIQDSPEAFDLTPAGLQLGAFPEDLYLPPAVDRDKVKTVTKARGGQYLADDGKTVLAQITRGSHLRID